jgi:general stress protein CsbA
VASIIAGGPAPFIATALFAAFHTGNAKAYYIFEYAVISMVATSLLTDHMNKDIS